MCRAASHVFNRYMDKSSARARHAPGKAVQQFLNCLLGGTEEVRYGSTSTLCMTGPPLRYGRLGFEPCFSPTRAPVLFFCVVFLCCFGISSHVFSLPAAVRGDDAAEVHVIQVGVRSCACTPPVVLGVGSCHDVVPCVGFTSFHFSPEGIRILDQDPLAHAWPPCVGRALVVGNAWCRALCLTAQTSRREPIIHSRYAKPSHSTPPPSSCHASVTRSPHVPYRQQATTTTTPASNGAGNKGGSSTTSTPNTTPGSYSSYTSPSSSPMSSPTGGTIPASSSWLSDEDEDANDNGNLGGGGCGAAARLTPDGLWSSITADVFLRFRHRLVIWGTSAVSCGGRLKRGMR